MAHFFRARRRPFLRLPPAIGCILLISSCTDGDPIRSYTIEPIRQPEPLTYDVPTDWNEVAPGGFQMALFMIGEGDDAGEASISSAGGGLDQNINRWRMQVDLSQLSIPELAELLESTEVDGKPAYRVHLEGAERSIRGVIVPGEQSNWFFKLTGPTELVEQESARFDAFVQAVQFAD